LIDKVEVHIPRGTHFSDEFRRLYADIRKRPGVDPFRPARHYKRAGDLRRFGYDVILDVDCIRDREGNHKLELLDTGAMSYSQMQNEIERVFDVDARKLILLRVDLAVDVEDVPVTWFMRHVRARWKRFVCDIGRIESEAPEYTRIGGLEPQTFYLGKRPNCFRIYDKIAEYRHQYAQLTRRISDPAEFLDFQTKYGYPETGITLTRVERQIGGGRIPSQLETFGRLRWCASFNPFDELEFYGGGAVEPQITDCAGATEYLAGVGLRRLVEEWGIHRLHTLVNEYSGGHASRIFRAYQQFLPAEAGITAERLYSLYQESVRRQVAA